MTLRGSLPNRRSRRLPWSLDGRRTTGTPAAAALTSALDAMLQHATPVLRRSLAGPGSGDDPTPPTTPTSPGAGGFFGWTGV